MNLGNWYNLEHEQVVIQLQSDSQKGLSIQAVENLQHLIGYNEWQIKTKKSRLVLFFQQFQDFMVYVLLAACGLSILLGEMLDAIAILAIVMLNGVFGYFQESKAEKSLQALRALSAPTTKVIREGKVDIIAARELVPGDLVVLESGDRIPADVRWISTMRIVVEESALTGESLPVEKDVAAIAGNDVALGDRFNMGFLGTLIQQGTGIAIVVATGSQTEMGKIAGLLDQVQHQQTPMQLRLEQLGKILIVVALALTALVVGAGIWRGMDVLTMVWAGVSLAVAAIPEGLPAVVTIALALGVQRMIKRNAIIRKLPAVETLGCVEVICTDKTGTLTQNKMTVMEMWSDNQIHMVTGEKVSIGSTQNLMVQAMVLCNNAQWNEDERIGDPTEVALLEAAHRFDRQFARLYERFKRLHEHPFDSTRKRMSVVVAGNEGQFVYVKGAADSLITRCSAILVNGQQRKLDECLVGQVEKAQAQLAGKAMRVLGLAMKVVRVKSDCIDVEEAESDLVFLGLVGMIDPPREEVKVALQTCKQAGIRTIMITGDHAITASAIASELNLLKPGGLIVEGKQLENWDERELDRNIEKIVVYARVTPEHKLRIVQALQRKGYVVAMTGDGVNDAPAIKTADIGIAMGQTGTDVSKEAASLVLRDDNFATIVAAIEEGRNIYENVRKVIRYLLASNVGEILTMFLAMMVGLPLPLVPIQILWVNLITDGLPAMALGVDPAENHLMQKKPRGAREHIFAERLGWKIISRGLMIGVCTIAAFIVVYSKGVSLIHAQTVAFSTLVFAQLIHVFDCRSSRSIFHRRFLENKSLVTSVIISLVLLLAVIYMPIMQPIFETEKLYVVDWLIVTLFASIPTFLLGIFSVWRNRAKPISKYSS